MPRRGRGLGAWLGGGGEVAVLVWLAGFGCFTRYSTLHNLGGFHKLLKSFQSYCRSKGYTSSSTIKFDSHTTIHFSSRAPLRSR